MRVELKQWLFQHWSEMSATDRARFPQQTLYLPAPWLKKGTNEVVIFTFEGHSRGVRGLRAPILDELGSE